MEKPHFSHEQHVLILMKGERDEIVQKSLCHGCQIPVCLEPTYSCGECGFFLHKKCAELPTYFQTHDMHPQHPLSLLKKPPYDTGSCQCYCCGQSWSNFTYHCEACSFDLDILCATLEDRKLEHPSHQHALISLRKRVPFECHACGEIKEDSSYLCGRSCSYWIHEKCASLPTIKKRKDHDHTLSLAYALSNDYIAYRLSCGVCNERLKPYHWIYHCGLCRYAVHLKCIETEKGYKREDSTIIQEGFLSLPTDNFAGDILETSDFQKVRMKNTPRIVKHETSDLQDFVETCLGHPMVDFDVREDSNTRGKEITCEACTDPIVSACCKRVNSDYFLHVTCALLGKTIIHFVDGKERYFFQYTLTLPATNWDFFKCDFCKLDCNGYYYYTKEGRPHYIDVKCFLLPSRMYHEAHRHELFGPKWLLSPFRNDQKDWKNTCNGCGDSDINFCFECTSDCKYYVGYECALLPKTAKHRWDKHPLILSFPPFSDHPEKFYCEVCEEEIHPLRWQYRCRECDQSFHPGCIPQLSSSRNIKFGVTVDVGEHPHTLQLVPEGQYRSACHSCGASLYGLRAFKCTATCKFYLCHGCVVKSKKSADKH